VEYRAQVVFITWFGPHTVYVKLKLWVKKTKIRILKNEADYEAALAEIEKRMESPRPDADCLELLALLVSD
jgi:hypothetical protein